MSCEDCAKAQDNTDTIGIAYYRWKNANVAIVGCEKHLREIFHALSEHQEKNP